MERVIVSIICAAAVLSPQFAAAQAPDWRALAMSDVEAATKETAENHPGMLDATNPNFPRLLSRARTEALKLARRTTTAGGYQATLGRFRAVIDDGHAGAYAELPENLAPPLRWAGFVAAWRGDAMYVYKSSPDGPPEGAQILSCDGTAIKTLVERNVFRFRSGRRTPGEWWSRARTVFVDDANPFITLPRACAFQTGGITAQRALTWSPVPDNYQALKNGSANGDLLPIGMTERAPGLFWYALPDFSPDDAGRAAYAKMFADTIAGRDKLLTARAIVLDLRFNNGGSSTWSRTLAGHLWGEDRLERIMNYHNRNVQIWWRPTPSSKKAMEAYRTEYTRQGDVETAQEFDKILAGFAQTNADGKDFWVEPNDRNPNLPPPADTLNTDPVALTTPVYVIVPGQCGSACLDAIDYFKRFPNTRLIGAPSATDSTYMEVRSGPFASGFGGAIIPMKIWVNRPRGNGVYYTPDILMTDLDWSTANFQRRIEADLAAR
jgi:Peptidase family S41